MRSLNNNLGSLSQCCHRAAPGNYGKSLSFILWETSHPLMQYRGYRHIFVSVPLQVFLCQLLQHPESRYVLHQISALSIAYGHILHALLGSQHSLYNGNRIGHGGRYQSSRKGTIGLTVNGYARLLINSGQTVHILPVINSSLQRNILGIWNVVGNTAALIAGKASGIADFC